MNKIDSHIFAVGDSFVGKTTYLRHYFHGASSSFNSPTIGQDFFNKTFASSDGSSLNICFWDTAGQERFNSLTTNHFKHERSGLILMFSLTDESSLENCITWHSKLTDNSPLGSKLPTILVGNKKDLMNARRVLEEDIEKVSKKLNAKYFLISSITGENMNDSVEYICELVKNLPENITSTTIPINASEDSNNDENSNNEVTNSNSNCFCI